MTSMLIKLLSAAARLEEEARVVYLWLWGKGVKELDYCPLIRCFTASFLETLLKSTTKLSKGNFSIVARIRYLWNKQAAKVLNYNKLQHFSFHIREIIKLKMFPEKIHDVESRDVTKFCISTPYNVEAGRIDDIHCPDV
jgi:hypothetical protein